MVVGVLRINSSVNGVNGAFTCQIKTCQNVVKDSSVFLNEVYEGRLLDSHSVISVIPTGCNAFYSSTKA